MSAPISMKIAYIAGPFRGPTPWDIAQNVRRAEEVGLLAFRAGFMPLIPHANTHLFHGQGDDLAWIEGTKELLRRSDVVVLVSGWRSSDGTRGELREALARSMPTYLAISGALHLVHPETIRKILDNLDMVSKKGVKIPSVEGTTAIGTGKLVKEYNWGPNIPTGFTLIERTSSHDLQTRRLLVDSDGNSLLRSVEEKLLRNAGWGRDGETWISPKSGKSLPLDLALSEYYARDVFWVIPSGPGGKPCAESIQENAIGDSIAPGPALPPGWCKNCTRNTVGPVNRESLCRKCMVSAKDAPTVGTKYDEIFSNPQVKFELPLTEAQYLALKEELETYERLRPVCKKNKRCESPDGHEGTCWVTEQ